LLAIGLSNASLEFTAFQHILPRGINPHLVLVNGAQGEQDAEMVANPAGAFWSVVEERLRQAGVSAQQVQAVWLKEAIAQEHEPFPADAQRLQRALRAIVQILQQRYPNLQLVYLSSRIYAGYATVPLNPEPYAYESGFAVKWLIAEQFAHEPGLDARPTAPHQMPWLAWGPYLWADGLRERSDGLIWTCQDVVADGTHPSMSGRLKVARLLLHFFQTDQTAKHWFLG
jgi:hypothetical protein